ncbi:hypothetical protein BGZ46_003249 [Entomortierella lignicola]|nr:hypothetical protein BGZ46_003249 [Entomortierella lignicola]
MSTLQEVQTEKGHITVGYGVTPIKRKPRPIKLYYEKTGNGPIKILMIAGLGTPSSCWDSAVEYFSARPEYTTLIFDNRGAGYSEAPFGLYSTNQMAHDALELLDIFGWKSNVNVAGMSMGGMISLELVLLDTKRFSSLVLTSTNAGRTAPQMITIRFMLRIITVLNPDLRLKLIAEQFYPKSWLEMPGPEGSPYKTNFDLVTPYLKKQYIDTPFPGIQASVAHCWAALTHYVSAKRLAQLRDSGIPMLVVTGTEDNFVRPSGSYYLHKRLGCKLVVFEGAGHNLPSERPIAYCELLEELIKKGSEGRVEVSTIKANL